MSFAEDRPSLSASDALAIIAKYLPREWSNVREDEVTVELITGGYVNTVHIVTRASESIVEPKQVVVHRAGGGVPTERGGSTPFCSRLDELMVLYCASQCGTGPRLYGMSEQLTVQEYFKSHTLKPEETLDERILDKLATVYAKFHSMDVPIARREYLSRIERLRDRLKDFSQRRDEFKSIVSTARPELNWEQVFQMDFIGEYEWMLQTFEKVTSRYVVISGDENYLNVLVGEGDDDRILLIDYDMTHYEARGYDLGGHFINRTIKWNDKVDKTSGFDILPDPLRRKFLQRYTQEIAVSSKRLDPPYDANGLDSVDHLMQEVDIGMLSYTLSWGLGILSSSERMVKIENASFCAVTHHLLSLYIRLKQQFVQEHANW